MRLSERAFEWLKTKRPLNLRGRFYWIEECEGGESLHRLPGPVYRHLQSYTGDVSRFDTATDALFAALVAAMDAIHDGSFTLP